LIDRHIAARLATANAVRAWEQCKAEEITSIAYPNRLLDVARDEEAARLAIVNYRPRGSRESRQKLIYLAAYLFATRGTLNANEMNSVLEAPRDRPSASAS
jgi:16S rRNA U1498 N3-methylase RsmE